MAEAIIADSAPPDPTNLSRVLSRIIQGGFAALTACAFAQPHNG